MEFSSKLDLKALRLAEQKLQTNFNRAAKAIADAGISSEASGKIEEILKGEYATQAAKLLDPGPVAPAPEASAAGGLV